MTKNEKLFYTMINVITIVLIPIIPLFNYYKKIVTVDQNLKTDVTIIGYDILFTNESLLSLIMAISSIIVVFFALYAISSNKKSTVFKSSVFATIMLTSFCLYYMLTSIVEVSHQITTIKKLYDNISYDYKITFATYIPLILSALSLTTLLLVENLSFKNSYQEVSEKPQIITYKQPQIKPSLDYNEISEKLKKFKDLLDKNIITQEEYDNIKSKILGK